MILGLVEHAEGRPDRLSLEMLSLAGRLGSDTGEPVHAVLFGAGAKEVAGQLSGRGVAVAHVVESDRLTEFAPAAWAASIAQLTTVTGPSIEHCAATQTVDDLRAKVVGRNEPDRAAI
jgi:electron transfer flavoprotein alpha subunit